MQVRVLPPQAPEKEVVLLGNVVLLQPQLQVSELCM